MAKNRVVPLLLTSIASSTMSSSYQAINPNGAEGAAFFFRINNDTNETITISYDGVNDHEIMLTDTIYETPTTQNNALPAGKVALFPIGQKIYVKGTSGTGSVYLSGFYQLVGE
jgi:hypothetical protein